MNNLLALNKEYKTRKKEPGGGISIATWEKMPVKAEILKGLFDDLEKVQDFWKRNTVLDSSVLVSVYEKSVLAKSNRISCLFRSGKKSASDFMVGARFYPYRDKKAHLFTYLLPKTDLQNSILLLSTFIQLFQETFGEEASQEQLKDALSRKIPEHASISLSSFYQLIHELSYVDRFDVYQCQKKIDDKAILVTLYKTETDTEMLLRKLGVSFEQISSLDSTTVLMDRDNYSLLLQKAPYLIAMSVKDFQDSVRDTDIGAVSEFQEPLLPPPDKEPTIGVIDTGFDSSVYFRDYVDYEYDIDPSIPFDKKDTEHGTAVDSLLVDLPDLNPKLDDGCGHFKVKHFAVATSTGNSIFNLLEKIQSIVVANYSKIHVWNLSLGSAQEVDENCISPVAALIDNLECKYNVLFVIAGTNKGNSSKPTLRVGSPADSINSVVVNSVTGEDKPASYSRTGPVLGFFVKPDVSYYGGEEDTPINVYFDRARHTRSGTSFAAPLIARKLCFLIDVMKLSREEAKALLINSAMKFDEPKDYDFLTLGHGVPPISIKEIASSKDDEIKFILHGSSKLFYTEDYLLPVPQEKGRFPYAVKATLCYFPTCNRNQGVDYTGTELGLSFGKIENKKITLRKDNNGEKGGWHTEEDSRKVFRKWDNVKAFKTKYASSTGMTASPEETWGIRITYFDRNLARNPDTGELPEINWGVVITLKAIDHKNRIDSFIQQCSLRQWLVTPLSIQEKVNTYVKMNEEIKFE